MTINLLKREIYAARLRRALIGRVQGFALTIVFGSLTAVVCAQQNGTTLRPDLPVIPQNRILITEFGAVGDGKTLNTEAFRKAVNACRAAGGCEVVVPAGVFVSGPIEMTSHMALVLKKGATVRGSEQFTDYDNTEVNLGRDATSKEKLSAPQSDTKPSPFTKSKAPSLPLIRAGNLTDVAIRGEGTIDGTGLVWWQRFRAERAAGAPQQGQAQSPVNLPQRRVHE